MEQEQRFLKALSAASGFRIQGDTLTLTDAEGTERLYFEAVYLR
jgi:heat shock protein HslJ